MVKVDPHVESAFSTSQIEMSFSSDDGSYEYDGEEESEYESDYDSEYVDSSDTETTYTSLEAALMEMTDRLAELDTGLESMAVTAGQLEQPVAAVAVGAFTNPRVLEAAPFRGEPFRLLPAAKAFLGCAHHTVSFGDLCEAIRKALRDKPVSVEQQWGTTDFMGVLQRLSDIVE